MHSESASFVSVLGAFDVIRVQPYFVEEIFPESSPQCDNFFFGTQNDALQSRLCFEFFN